MRVQEVMSDDVRTVPDKIHHLVVVDGRRIVGVLSERDARRARGVTTVEQLMTKAIGVSAPATGTGRRMS